MQYRSVDFSPIFLEIVRVPGTLQDSLVGFWRLALCVMAYINPRQPGGLGVVIARPVGRIVV